MKQAMDAPAPGRMPMMLPMIQERMTVGASIFFSALVRAILSENLEAFWRSLIFFSARMSTCDMEKRPMSAHVVLMPSARNAWPNMKRLVPSMGSRPIVERSRPSAPDMRPLTMDLLETPAMIVRPKIPSQNFSADMNFSASWASSGAKKYREMQLSRPPQKELQQAVASALPA